jgi:hypothetical protein
MLKDQDTVDVFIPEEVDRVGDEVRRYHSSHTQDTL